jgi:hypothetical protein
MKMHRISLLSGESRSDLCSGCNHIQRGCENAPPIKPAMGRFDQVLRMRHHAEHVALAALMTPAMSLTEPFGFVPSA